jgi:hypothetical protein
MLTRDQFYLCSTCFEASETLRECCGQPMLCCQCGEVGAERRQPPRTADGHFTSRAPRWFWEALRGVPQLLLI